jgi:hypothetical protein
MRAGGSRTAASFIPAGGDKRHGRQSHPEAVIGWTASEHICIIPEKIVWARGTHLRGLDFRGVRRGLNLSFQDELHGRVLRPGEE